jgi:hypothetical protein
MPARLRRKQITILLQDRHQGPCLTDDAEAWFDEIAVHLVLTCSEKGLPIVAAEWAAKHTPNLPKTYILAALERVKRKPPFYTSEDIGRRLNVTAEERERLGLTHIAACDVSARQVEAQKRAADRERKRVKRLAEGRRPRSLAATATQPWLAAGFNTRRTWERHGKPGPVASP